MVLEPEISVVDNKNSGFRGSRLTEEDIAAAIRATAGNVTDMATWFEKNRGIKVSYQLLAAKIRTNKDLRSLQREAEDKLLDVAEKKLMDLIYSGDKSAITFYLKTKGKRRGYSESKEITGADGGPVAVTAGPDIKVNFVTPKEEKKKK